MLLGFKKALRSLFRRIASDQYAGGAKIRARAWESVLESLIGVMEVGGRERVGKKFRMGLEDN